MSQVFSHHNISLFVVFVLMLPSPLIFAAQPNYDPPQPSAEFGTPKTILKILTSATFGHSLTRYDGKKVQEAGRKD